MLPPRAPVHAGAPGSAPRRKQERQRKHTAAFANADGARHPSLWHSAALPPDPTLADGIFPHPCRLVSAHDGPHRCGQSGATSASHATTMAADHLRPRAPCWTRRASAPPSPPPQAALVMATSSEAEMSCTTQARPPNTAIVRQLSLEYTRTRTPCTQLGDVAPYGKTGHAQTEQMQIRRAFDPYAHRDVNVWLGVAARSTSTQQQHGVMLRRGVLHHDCHVLCTHRCGHGSWRRLFFALRPPT